MTDNTIQFPEGVNPGDVTDYDETEQENVPVEGEEDGELKPAIGIHVVMMEDGQFGIQATGEPNLGEMFMLLSRACASVEARMVGETVTQVMKANKSRIITPGQ